MISAKDLIAAGAIIQRYEQKQRESAARFDRVFVYVEKNDLLCLVQLARAGLMALEEQRKAAGQ